MPGIFVSSIDKVETSELFPVLNREKDLSSVQEKPPTDARSSGSTRKRTLFLLLLLLPLVWFKWTPSKTKVFDLPRKHADFIGREKELRLLETRLLKKNPHEINILAISGEGGIGKTELAIAFANQHIQDFSLIGWINGTNEDTILHSYLGLGDLLQIKEEHPVKLRERVNYHLENHKGKPWLLIFDDMTTIPSHLPRSGGSVLLSCRDKSICPPESALELTKDARQAVQLLAKITKEKPSKAMEKLAEKLDYLPLMLNIAGHYIAETPTITLSNYSDIVSSTMETERSLFNTIEFRKRYPRSLIATYQMTLKLLGEKHPLSLEFFKEAVFLYPKNIPVEFLTHWLRKRGQYDPAQLALLQGDILRELQDHSLIRYDSKAEVFSIHQLLHQALMLEFKDKVSEGLKIISQFDAVSRYNPTQKDTIRPFQKILPQCLEILDRIQTPDYPAVKMALTVARYYVDTEHNLKKGEKYLLLAKKWAETWDDPIRGRIAFLQGVIKFRDGDRQKDQKNRESMYLQAHTFFTDALNLFQRSYKDELYQGIEQNPTKCTKEYQRAICMQFQAQMLRLLGRLEEAEQGLLLALRAFEEVAQGKEHFDIARILREQALILWERKEYEIAIANIEKVLAMQERVYGPAFSYQPTVAGTYRILGDFYRDRGQLLKSDKAYRKAIEINQTCYQTHIHPYVADLYHQRSVVLEALGKKSRAQKMEKKSQKIRSLLETNSKN